MFNIFKKKNKRQTEENSCILIYQADGVAMGERLYKDVRIYLSKDEKCLVGQCYSGSLDSFTISTILKNERKRKEFESAEELNRLTKAIMMLDN